MSASLHLLRVVVDAEKLFAFARQARVAAHDMDEGYAIHALFAALFDHGAAADARVAPKPFHIGSVEHRSIEVLAYGHLDRNAFIERAKTFADPTAWGVCDLERIASKPMPTAFPSGTRLGFLTRVCPVRRIAQKGPLTSARAEVDAFLAKSWEVGPAVPLDRNKVYEEWLVEQLEKDSAARVINVAVERFGLSRMLRRNHETERRGRRCGRPDVTLRGELEVAESEAFSRLLARGVGRHRAFGFGMVLLRPAGRG